MKKWIVALLALPMVITGCTTTAPQIDNEELTNGGQAGAGGIGGTLTVVTSRTDADELFAQIEKSFIEKYPKVTDIIWESSSDYTNYITTRMNTPEYGDVLFIPFSMSGEPDMYPTYFEPLGEVIALEKDYIDVTEADYEGIAYGLPSAINTLGLIYNEDVFEQAGITALPTTLEEFFATCEKIKNQTEAIPFYTQYGPGMGIWGGTLSSFGGENYRQEILDAGTAFAQGQPIRQVMDLFYGVTTKGYTEEDPVTLDGAQANQMMADGKIAMMIGGSQDVEMIDELSETSDISLAPLPAQRDGKTSVAIGAPDVLGINVNSQNKATARAFLEFFISDESDYAEELGGMSPLRADFSDEEQALFTTNNVVLTAPAVDPEVEARYTAIASEVGVARLTDVVQQVVNMGLYPDKHPAYETYIGELEARWAKAVANNADVTDNATK